MIARLVTTGPTLILPFTKPKSHTDKVSHRRVQHHRSQTCLRLRLSFCSRYQSHIHSQCSQEAYRQCRKVPPMFYSYLLQYVILRRSQETSIESSGTDKNPESGHGKTSAYYKLLLEPKIRVNEKF